MLPRSSTQIMKSFVVVFFVFFSRSNISLCACSCTLWAHLCKGRTFLGSEGIFFLFSKGLFKGNLGLKKTKKTAEMKEGRWKWGIKAITCLTNSKVTGVLMKRVFAPLFAALCLSEVTKGQQGCGCCCGCPPPTGICSSENTVLEMMRLWS